MMTTKITTVSQFVNMLERDGVTIGRIVNYPHKQFSPIGVQGWLACTAEYKDGAYVNTGEFKPVSRLIGREGAADLIAAELGL